MLNIKKYYKYFALCSRGNWIDYLRCLHVIMRKPLQNLITPLQLHLEISTACNLECGFCPRTIALKETPRNKKDSKWNNYFSIRLYENILQQMPLLDVVSLHGLGEPLLHRHLFDMIKIANSEKIRVRFSTNGTLLTEDISELLIKDNLWELTVSIDGASANTFEKIRSGASFNMVIRNITYLIEMRNRLGKKNPIVDVNFVLCRHNEMEAVQMLDLVKRTGLNSVIFSSLIPVNEEQKALICDVGRVNEIFRNVEEENKINGQSILFRNPTTINKTKSNVKKTYKCMHPWLSTAITIDGEVMPCCNINSIKYSMGNINNDSFAKIWNGAKYKAFRNAIKQKNNIPESCRLCPEY